MYVKKYDILIILIILIISLVFWLASRYLISEQNPIAEIYYYNKLVRTVDLGQGIERLFSIAEKPNVVFHLFQDGSICFEKSDCPQKLCVKTGRIHNPGQFAACLPNGIIIKITSASDNKREVDILIGN